MAFDSTKHIEAFVATLSDQAKCETDNGHLQAPNWFRFASSAKRSSKHFESNPSEVCAHRCLTFDATRVVGVQHAIASHRKISLIQLSVALTRRMLFGHAFPVGLGSPFNAWNALNSALTGPTCQCELDTDKVTDGEYGGCKLATSDIEGTATPLFEAPNADNEKVFTAGAEGLTQQRFLDLCAENDKNFKYFGLFNGDTCRCSSTLTPALGDAEDSIQCNVGANGDDSQAAGGDKELTVFTNKNYELSTEVTNGEFDNCYLAQELRQSGNTRRWSHPQMVSPSRSVNCSVSSSFTSVSITNRTAAAPTSLHLKLPPRSQASVLLRLTEMSFKSVVAHLGWLSSRTLLTIRYVHTLLSVCSKALCSANFSYRSFKASICPLTPTSSTATTTTMGARTLGWGWDWDG
ncbi:hypothetical protein CC86DRAFT_377372 [Ophiobolus disseminans]|uniref:Uncharacterized protein n=1 Tax=Ophiobolus disseminans TaxID=1469910 RepID=A0A6A7AHL2_9PLEO|nr:hypothetical protein CC86DRAFT_377372 [Ophiobolus disseminans]